MGVEDVTLGSSIRGFGLKPSLGHKISLSPSFVTLTKIRKFSHLDVVLHLASIVVTGRGLCARPHVYQAVAQLVPDVNLDDGSLLLPLLLLVSFLLVRRHRRPNQVLLGLGDEIFLVDEALDVTPALLVVHKYFAILHFRCFCNF